MKALFAKKKQKKKQKKNNNNINKKTDGPLHQMTLYLLYLFFYLFSRLLTGKHFNSKNYNRKYYRIIKISL